MNRAKPAPRVILGYDHPHFGQFPAVVEVRGLASLSPTGHSALSAGTLSGVSGTASAPPADDSALPSPDGPSDGCLLLVSRSSGLPTGSFTDSLILTS